MTKFLLDSGDVREYKEISELAKKQNSEIWGATTNPTLIAKALTGKKLSQPEAFEMQREIVMEILDIVPGAVSAEVYADESTTAEEMITQGEEIATWGDRIYVKLPTTLEGFKARTKLREKNIPVNNTLVFSQEQILAIMLHEKIIRKTVEKSSTAWPQLISPFAGRLEDKGLNGMRLIEHGMTLRKLFTPENYEPETWILAASIRTATHLKQCLAFQVDSITAPAKTFREWFMLSEDQIASLDVSKPGQIYQDISYKQPDSQTLAISTIEAFMEAIGSNRLDIRHELTTAGIQRFVADWKAIISS